MKIGIDAGGTLIKVAYTNGDLPEFIKFPISRLQYVASWISEFSNAKICITGGKAALLKTYMNQKAVDIVEFEATSSGVSYLLARNDIPVKAFILTNVGTGTSIHYINKGEHQRVGGTGVGGGTIMGLSKLLTGITDYETIVTTASKGARDRIDLKVSHIYEGSEPPIPGDLTASNFGNIAILASEGQLTKEELLASVVGLVGETVATVSVLAAGQSGLTSIVFVGSSFIGNDLLKEVVQRYTVLRGALPMFIENGEYSGAIGCLLYLG
ncbi:type II pantothenate kinase [Paenibacillus psychroresistens]|uniref:Type II pantothenate kinase n=1 Tax=Paenibacillus psychroresistens TaxID=1778678 RepID=A0A6B8RTG5_9BACL|nr:type II pantothenate kinase [Paenibacillus psychroresistens]QGQ99094.1 type II pantothenate kinase [Paenibacillus psychroresistens]